MRHRHVVMVVGLVLAAAGRPALAGEARTLADLDRRLEPGTEVEVVDREGRVIRGAWARADEEGVLLSGFGGDAGRRLAAADIVSVTRHGDSLKNGLIIGGAIGLGSGLLVMYTEPPAGEPPLCERNDTACKVTGTLALTALYAGVGALIDRAVKGRTVAYRAPSDRLAVSVKPQLVPRGGGVKVAVRF